MGGGLPPQRGRGLHEAGAAHEPVAHRAHVLE